MNKIRADFVSIHSKGDIYADWAADAGYKSFLFFSANWARTCPYRCSLRRWKRDCLFAKSYGGPFGMLRASPATPAGHLERALQSIIPRRRGGWVPEVASSPSHACGELRASKWRTTLGPCEKQLPRPPDCGRARNATFRITSGKPTIQPVARRVGLRKPTSSWKGARGHDRGGLCESLGSHSTCQVAVDLYLIAIE